MFRFGLVTSLALAGAMGIAFAEAPSVKTVPCAPSSPASGQEMYVAYCASCHGIDGKGAGPAAEAFKVPPTDLTLATATHGGSFPGFHVSATILGDAGVLAHGSKDMPVWGPIFRKLSHNDESVVQLRVANLTKYVESLQTR